MIISVIFLMVSCTQRSRVKSEPLTESKKIIQSEKFLSDKESVEIDMKREGILQSGIASWYGIDFHGRKTANGEIYDMNKLTAAHKTLPFNVLVEVENVENNKTVLVRINDRGPFVDDRIIDLSYKAAQMLDMVEKGTSPVHLRIINAGDIKGNSKKLLWQNEYYLQVGAFKDLENAKDMLRKVRSLLPEANFRIIFKDLYYKVISNKLKSRSAAEEMMTLLEKYHIEVFIKEYQ